jgi:hypothetical protein
MNTKCIIMLCGLLSQASTHADNSETVIKSKDGTTTTIAISKHLINVKNSNTEQSIEFYSENELHVATDDYNFDGYPDFSVWHIDEGMGTYTIHRTFIYAPKEQSFYEVAPKCGDEFINLKVDRKKKRLQSTYFDNNAPKLCYTKITISQPRSGLP